MIPTKDEKSLLLHWVMWRCVSISAIVFRRVQNNSNQMWFLGPCCNRVIENPTSPSGINQICSFAAQEQPLSLRLSAPRTAQKHVERRACGCAARLCCGPHLARVPAEAPEASAGQDTIRGWRDAIVALYAQGAQAHEWPEKKYFSKDVFKWYLRAHCPDISTCIASQLIHTFMLWSHSWRRARFYAYWQQPKCCSLIEAYPFLQIPASGVSAAGACKRRGASASVCIIVWRNFDQHHDQSGLIQSTFYSPHWRVGFLFLVLYPPVSSSSRPPPHSPTHPPSLKSHQYHAVQSGAEATINQHNPTESEIESLSKDIIQLVRFVDGHNKEPICCLLSHNLGWACGNSRLIFVYSCEVRVSLSLLDTNSRYGLPLKTIAWGQEEAIVDILQEVWRSCLSE